jgi:CheY-like chemotaxis protein
MKDPSATKRRVLVVDDSELACAAVRGALEKAGFEVVTMTTPFGFTNALTREQPALVLLDIGMPGLSGERLVSIVRTKGPPGCKVVFYSAREPQELEQQLRQCQADGAVHKSVRGPDLTALVQKYLS